MLLDLFSTAIFDFFALFAKFTDQFASLILFLFFYFALIYALWSLLFDRHQLVVMYSFLSQFFSFFLPTIIFEEFVQVLILVEAFFYAIAVSGTTI